VRLIAPAYVKPFIKRQKNDAADAEAICEAAQRPSMRFVPVKTEEQQANGIVFRARDLLVRQRTQCVNALRGHLMEFERFGIFEAAPVSDNPSQMGDLGRFAITGQERDRFVFRVPSLRNVALTAPYFHDGSAATLATAVNVMARKQLGRTLGGTEVDLLVGFLKTLTGEYRGRRLDRPTAVDEP
jgi:cytochrome c peroxidase